MTKRSARGIALAFSLAGVLGALVIAESAAETKSSETYRQLNLFGDVFERVRSEYVEEVGDEELIEAAINGMLTSLDPHSSYLNEDNFRDMQVQTRGEFGGLGIEVTMQDGLVRVVSPIDDTPAFRAGLEAGDLITHLDEEPVMGLTLSEAVDKMRGPVGTEITITVRRGGLAGEPFDVVITRDIIQVRSVRSRPEGNVGYIRITAFNEQTKGGVEEAIASLEEEIGPELKGFVLDLRNNPGGLLDQAIYVADSFLDAGEIVSTRSRDPEDSQRFNATEGDLADGKPIVVLINGGSASASEIVAGALQDHRRAIVLGTQSFGKGSVQTIVPISGHGAMRLTTAHYYTPSGRSIQAKGIAPDIDIKPARVEELSDLRRRRESDLRGALDNPDGEDDAADVPGSRDRDSVPPGNVGAEDAPTEPAGDEAAPVDYQLARALDLLKGVALFGERVDLD